jgi:response regulator RpfG family c-di-GMP phosphodiesterase
MGRKRRVLVIDDDELLCELIRTTFELEGFEVGTARDVIEAERALAKSRPDAILLDIGLPGIDGVFYLERLRETPHTSRIPIVAISGSEEAGRAATAAGAEAFVRKPFSPLELLAVVEGLLGRTSVPTQPRRSRSDEEEELLLYARDLRHMLEIERAQRLALQESYLETVTALAIALDTKDTGTRQHSERVRRYADELLEAVAPERKRDDPSFEYGFLLHDIGKIGIPDGILQKPGPLTRAERRRMQTHTVIGEQMLGGVAVLRGEGLCVVRSHHERWDGRGYPDGREGADIPLGARIFAVADALDAMTSNRPYRRALPWRTARAEIVAQTGKQFDPDVVDAFRERERSLAEVRRELAAA